MNKNDKPFPFVCECVGMYDGCFVCECVCERVWSGSGRCEITRRDSKYFLYYTKHTHTHTHTHIYIHLQLDGDTVHVWSKTHTRTHAHTHIYIYTFNWTAIPAIVFMCVCVSFLVQWVVGMVCSVQWVVCVHCVCACVCASASVCVYVVHEIHWPHTHIYTPSIGRRYRRLCSCVVHPGTTGKRRSWSCPWACIRLRLGLGLGLGLRLGPGLEKRRSWSCPWAYIRLGLGLALGLGLGPGLGKRRSWSCPWACIVFVCACVCVVVCVCSVHVWSTLARRENGEACQHEAKKGTSLWRTALTIISSHTHMYTHVHTHTHTHTCTHLYPSAAPSPFKR